MMKSITVRRWGLKSRTQLPLLMVWDEYRYGGEVEHATVVFSTRDLRSFWWWRELFRKTIRSVRAAAQRTA